MLLRYIEKRKKKKRVAAVNDDDDDDDYDYGDGSSGAAREVVGKRVREARFNTRTSQQLVLHQMVLHTTTIVLRTFSRMGASVSPSARDRNAFICASRMYAEIHMQASTRIAPGPILSQSGRDVFDAEYYRYYSSLSGGPLTRPVYIVGGTKNRHRCSPKKSETRES